MPVRWYSQELRGVMTGLTWSPGQHLWPYPAHCWGCVLPVSPLAPPPAPPPSAGTGGSSPTRCALEFPGDVWPGWAPADRWPPALRWKIEHKVSRVTGWHQGGQQLAGRKAPERGREGEGGGTKKNPKRVQVRIRWRGTEETTAAMQGTNQPTY